MALLDMRLTRYRNTTSLAALTGVNRSVIERQVAHNILRPDAYVVSGRREQPLFKEDKAVEVVRNAHAFRTTISQPATNGNDPIVP